MTPGKAPRLPAPGWAQTQLRLDERLGGVPAGSKEEGLWRFVGFRLREALEAGKTTYACNSMKVVQRARADTYCKRVKGDYIAATIYGADGNREDMRACYRLIEDKERVVWPRPRLGSSFKRLEVNLRTATCPLDWRVPGQTQARVSRMPMGSDAGFDGTLLRPAAAAPGSHDSSNSASTTTRDAGVGTDDWWPAVDGGELDRWLDQHTVGLPGTLDSITEREKKAALELARDDLEMILQTTQRWAMDCWHDLLKLYTGASAGGTDEGGRCREACEGCACQGTDFQCPPGFQNP
ncbi:hypothetical protein SCUCBS95973_005995 [Sporothrix curviconia]|uniref:Uncharacterized protein n=1 Tax=Sporothrix curviconia TaxID=1260050 RepID=A0ABP0C3K6_9PEZI